MSSNISKITMERIDDHINFKAKDKNGTTILMDGSPAVGGQSNGVSPMETLLMAAAGCSSIDVVLILKKMKQTISDLKVTVEAERVKVADATEFKTIHIHFDLQGDIKEKKLQQAIEMSLEKYFNQKK